MSLCILILPWISPFYKSSPVRHIFRLEDYHPVPTLRSYTLPGTLVSLIIPSSPHPAISCLDLRYFPCVTLAYSLYFPPCHVDVVSARFRFLHVCLVAIAPLSFCCRHLPYSVNLSRFRSCPLMTRTLAPVVSLLQFDLECYPFFRTS